MQARGGVTLDALKIRPSMWGSSGRPGPPQARKGPLSASFLNFDARRPLRCPSRLAASAFQFVYGTELQEPLARLWAR